MVHEAGKKGVQILCLQEIYNGPYFCPSKDRSGATSRGDPRPTVEEFQKVAKQYGMAIVVPIYEREMAGVYYNSAAVIDADGSYLGKYRKNHIRCEPGLLREDVLQAGQPRLPRLPDQVREGRVYICYDRHFPKVRACSGSTAPRSCSTPRRRSPA